MIVFEGGSNSLIVGMLIANRRASRSLKLRSATDILRNEMELSFEPYFETKWPYKEDISILISIFLSKNTKDLSNQTSPLKFL